MFYLKSVKETTAKKKSRMRIAYPVQMFSYNLHIYKPHLPMTDIKHFRVTQVYNKLVDLKLFYKTLTLA